MTDMVYAVPTLGASGAVAAVTGAFLDRLERLLSKAADRENDSGSTGLH